MVKNIKRKIVLFFLIVLSIVGLNAFKIEKTSNAATSNLNQWVNIGSSNTQVRICYTEDVFVNEKIQVTIFHH